MNTKNTIITHANTIATGVEDGLVLQNDDPGEDGAHTHTHIHTLAQGPHKHMHTHAFRCVW
jgi:hypothetical protein